MTTSCGEDTLADLPIGHGQGWLNVGPNSYKRLAVTSMTKVSCSK